MKTRIVAFVILMLGAAALQAEPYFFRPEGWVVGTEFPSEPKLSQSRTPKPEGDIVESRAVYESASEAFMLTRVSYPVSIKKGRVDAAYDGAKNGMLHATKATLISEKKIEILGRDARRYVGSYNNGTMIFEVRMVIIGDELYMLMHAHPKGEASIGEAAAFFEKVAEKKDGE